MIRKKPAEVWYEALKEAMTYEEWEEAAFQLDAILGNDLWYAPALVWWMVWQRGIETDAEAGDRIRRRSTMITG
jgi:hypothetical protein